MLIYEIKSEVKLPHYTKWFTTSYIDNGDLLFKKFINSEYDDPNDWRENHKEFDYNIPELDIIKTKLDASKSSLDFTLDGSDIEKSYTNITKIIRNCEKLRGKTGHIKINYNAEIVSNAWLKMYELCTFLEPLMNDNEINSFHLAEAPGNFLLAINHYIKTNHPDIKWNWIANTYNTKVYTDTNYFKDCYSIEKQYESQWDYGCDMDGDITSHNNARYYLKKYKKSKIHFITSDAKYVQQIVDFNNEEIINIPVHVGQIVNSLFILSDGGTMILKHFTFLTTQSICLIMLVKIYFETVKLVKPISSKPGSSETYLVCINYNKPLSKVQTNKLLNYMNYIKHLNNKNGCPTLFKNCIPKSLINEMIEISTSFSKLQITHIEYNLSKYHTYKTIENSQIWNDFLSDHNTCINTWLELYGIKYLKNCDKMISHQSKYPTIFKNGLVKKHNYYGIV